MTSADKGQPFSFQFAPPPGDLKHLVNTFFFLETTPDRIDEVLPSYSAQIMVFLRGEATMHFEQGSQSPAGPVFINAPLMQAAPFTLEGPSLCVGASLTHLGWASLARLPVDEVHDQLCAPEEVFPPDIARRLCALAKRSPSQKEAIANALSDIIRETATPLRPLHEQMIHGTTEWLASAFSPPVEDLYERLPLSPRQVQRLCKRFFGVPPTRLLKRFRAIRAAAMLAQDNLPEEVRDEVLSAYFDQSHLINDIRRYTGRTPSLLVKGPLVTDTLDPEGHGPAAKALRDRLTPD